EVTPNPTTAVIAAAIAESPEEALSLSYHEPLPRWFTWVGLVEWLATEADIPIAARPEAARIFELWQIHTPDGYLHRAAVADKVWSWLRDNSGVRPVRRHDDSSPYYDRL